MRRGLLASALVLLSAPAFADPPAPTVLHLTETAEKRLPRDLLHADLRAEAVGKDPQTVEATINQSMTMALAAAKQVAGIDIVTGSYAVYRNEPQKAPAEWTGSQSLHLAGNDAGALLKLTGVLQSQGLVMADLAYEASHATVRKAEDELTGTALSGLDRRAAAIAEQLHLAVQGYRDLTIGNAQTEGGPMPRFAVATAAMSAPPPVAAPGEATVRVTVTADILLAPKQP
jgi:predicted secreted protein